MEALDILSLDRVQLFNHYLPIVRIITISFSLCEFNLDFKHDIIRYTIAMKEVVTIKTEK